MRNFYLLSPKAYLFIFSKVNKKSLILSVLLVFFGLTMQAQNRVIVNESFETGSIVPHNDVAYPESQVGDNPQIDGWYSTHPTYNGAEGAIEHWRSGFQSTPSQDGNYHVELNVAQPSRLYQIVYLNNGEVIDYEYHHRKRQTETQTVEFSVYSQDGSTKIQTLSTNTASSQSSWDNVTGSATFTGPSGIYQIGFEATAPASGGSGNFLDNISISLDGLTEFNTDAITITEGDPLDLHFIVNGVVQAASSVTFSTSGTAVAGVDYTFSPTTVNVPPGNYAVADSLSTGLVILDNAYSDGTRTLTLNISSVSGDIQTGDSNGDGNNQTITITILDDDPAPAGVQGVQLWLDASDVDGDGNSGNDPADGTDISTWADKSGNGNDVTVAGITQSTVNAPAYFSNQFNGKSALRFEKSNQEALGKVLSTNYTGPLTVFVVIQSQTPTPAQFDSFFSSWYQPFDPASFQIDYDGSSAFRVNATGGTTVLFGPANQELELYAVRYQSNLIQTFTDGNLANQSAYASDLGFSEYRVGVNRAGANFFDSKIAEVIVYYRALDACDLEKVNLYLGNKYGRDFNNLAANYDYESTFPGDVTGIGAFASACSGLNTIDSATSSIITIVNPSSNNTAGEFLTLGHDNAVLGEQEADLPATYPAGSKRLTREWKFDRDGDVGTVDLTMDISGLTLSGTPSNYALLLDLDGDGDFTTGTVNKIVASSASATSVVFNGITLPNNAVATLLTLQVTSGGVPGANLWLKADIGAFESGGNLTGWDDQSGTNTFTVNGTPTYSANSVNFNPVVGFSNTSGKLVLPTHRLEGDTPITYQEGFAVYKYNTQTESGTVIGGITSGTNYGKAIFAADGNLRVYAGTGTNNTYQSFENTDLVNTYTINNLEVALVASPFATGRLNSENMTITPGTGGNFNSISLTPMIGGTENNGAADGWYPLNGNVAEVILYPFSLTVAAKQKIESYLAVKYGISLDPSVGDYVDSSGNSIWNNTTYWNDVFGIGRDDAASLNQSNSNSINTGTGDGTGQVGAGNVVLSNPTDLGDGEYLIVGHDNGALAETTTDLPPALAGFSRLTREWWAQETGDVGNVTMAFDLNGITVTGTNVDQFRLLIDGDGDGNFTTGQPSLIEASSFTGNIVTFNGVNIPSGRAMALITEAPTPGGVGSERLWLEANEGVSLSGNNVTGWADQTAHNFFTVVGTPTYNAQAINFNPSIGFANTGDGSTLPANRLDGNNPIQSVVAFAVMRSNDNTSTLLGSTVSGARGRALFGYRGDDNLSSGNGQNNRFKYFAHPSPGTFTIASFDIGSAPGAYTLDGLTGALTSAGGGFTTIDLTPMIGGTLNSGPAAARWQPFNGDVAEIIVYPNTITAADILEVNSYLAVKYGITLDASVGNYLDSAGNPVWSHAAYWNDVFGIARDDNGGLLQTSSNSMNTGSGNGTGQSGQGNITIGSPTSFDNGDYLMIGNDSGALTETTAELPASYSCYVRLEREWKIQMTGDIESVVAFFDISGLSLSGTQASDFKILIDRDGDGDFTTGSVTDIDAASLSGSIVRFNIDFTQFASPNGTVFTFITGNENIAPVAVCQDITVQLDATGNISITPAQIDNGSTDNCLPVTLSLDTTDFTCADIGDNTVTLTVTDPNGNSATCTATVTVEDTTPPAAVCQDITIQLDEFGLASITPANIDNGSSDNCGIDTLALDVTSFTCADVGANTVTLTVTDVNANVSTCTAIVTVEDNIPPVAVCQDITFPLPASGTITLTPAAIDNGSTDACGIASRTISPSTFTCADIGANTVTLTVTDNNGNVSTCLATVTVEDNAPPSITCPGDSTLFLDASCQVALLDYTPGASALDNCTPSPSITLTQSPAPGTIISGVGVVTLVTITAEDASGNTASCSFNVTTVDNTPPVISCAADDTRDTTLGVCGYIVQGTEFDATFTDNCSGGSITNDLNGATTIAGVVLPVGDTTVLWTATDGSGNVSTCTTTITIEDNTAPNITCAADATRDTDPGVCSYTVQGIEFDASAGDPCGIATFTNDYNGSGTLDGAVLPAGATTVTWTVTDIYGNTATCTTVITVQDNEAPNAVCQDIALQLDATGNATITAADVDGGSSDACGIASLSVSPSAFTCADVGPNTVTLTVTDVNGNSATCTANVVVVDITPPTAVCQDITVQLDGAGNVTITPGDIDGGSSDACGIASLSVSQDSFTCADVGPNVVTLTVTDVNGNSATCTATVTVEDNIPPVAICQDISIQLDPTGTVTITGADVDGGSLDNCAIASLDVSPNTFTCADVGLNSVTLTVTDVNGNTDTCTANVFVADITPPVAVCQDISIQLDASGNATITGVDVDGGSTDACGIASLDVSPNTFTCADVGPNTVTLTVTDVNGNSSTCTATVVVVDITPPVAVCQDITIQLDASGNASITGADIDGGSTDACGIVSLDASPNAFTCADVGPNTVTLTVTDVNGNSATCTAIVTVEDTIPPVITCAPDGSRDTDPGVCTYTVVGNEFDATFTDNCATTTLTNDLNGTNTIAGEVLPLGDTTVTWTVDDGNGNSATCSVTITVEDNEPPTINCPANAVRDTDPDLCDYTVQGTEFDPTYSDNCSIGSVSNDYNGGPTLDGAVFPLGTTTVTWTVIDGSGNNVSCSFNVIVEDNQAPTISCAADGTRDTDPGVCEYTVVGNEFDATFTDNCTTATITNDLNGTDTIAGEILPLGDTTVIWTVDDGNGNTATCSVTITVEDNEVPVIACPADVNANTDPGVCGAEVFFSDAIATDNCGIASVVQTSGLPSGSTFPVGVSTVEFQATDVNGNVSTCSFTITVTDNEAPLAVCQDITIQLDANGNASITASDIDGGSTDNCGIDTITASQTDFTCADVGDNNVTLTVTDVNGNVSTCVAIVTVEDVTDPMAVCQDITVELDVNGTVTIDPSDVDGGSSDSCGIADLSIDIDTFGCEDVGDNVVTLTVTDVNGNVSTCTAIVTVEDNIPPVLVCQDITVELDENGQASIVADDLIASNDDACGILTTAADIVDFDCDDIGAPILVTVFSSDNNGNLSSCEAFVTVIDALPPVIENCPDDLTVDPGPNNLFYELPDYWATGDVTATDNCTDPVTIFGQDPAPGTLLADGTYTITLTAEDEYGNVGICEFELTVESTLGDDNPVDFATLQLFPNPATSEFYLRNPQSLQLENLRIFDMMGRLIETFDVSDMGVQTTIDISWLQTATYMVIVEGEGGKWTEILLKE